MDSDIRPLIRNYLALGARAIAELREAYPALDNILNWRQVGIPREGTLPSGRTFFFHGIGCRFERGDEYVDLDFGENGETNGFDAWRIVSCQEDRVADSGITRADVQHALERMYDADELTTQPGRSLYYFKS